MNSLILDCSCGMNVFALRDEKVVSFQDKTQNKHSDEILKVIDELLNKLEITVKDLDNICVCVGPGSFTGVRVAVSIAKGLAVGSGARVCALSNFDMFKILDKEAFLVLDGFSNFVYVREIKNELKMDYCIEIEEFAEKMKKHNCLVYHTTEKTQNLLKKYEIESIFIENQTISAFLDEIQSGRFVKLNQIYPVYLRASQAEIEREKRNK